MSSLKNQRLRLFAKGNTRCPICLAGFSWEGVETGKEATLEHVPPRKLAQERGIPSRAMCLTCRECNESAGRGVDQAATRAARLPTGRIDINGQPHTVWVDDKGNMAVRSRLPAPKPGELPDFMKSGELIVRFRSHTERYINVSYLRAAYLTVFSLLGEGGYLFAETPALRLVREQIQRPEEEIVTGYARGIDMPELRDGSYMICKPVTCWGVKMGDCLVLLPAGDRDSFYDKVGPIGLGTEFTLGGPLWFPAKFGAVRVGVITFAQEFTDKDREAFQFAGKGQLTLKGSPHEIILALRVGRSLVLMHAGGLE